MAIPIFIFSLPRSGSTLLQRMMSSHAEIATTSEPWILLPLLTSLKAEGTITDFSHRYSYDALNDLAEILPRGIDDLYGALGLSAQRIYDLCASGGEVYFLDKTPRYYQIIPEIAAAFPHAKFIFLYRNPLDIVGSVLRTWHDGKLFKLYLHWRDILEGGRLLTQGAVLLKDRSLSINYEELVQSPRGEMGRVAKFLEIPWDDQMLEPHSNLVGAMGDQTGIKKYQELSSSSVGSWKALVTTRYRKRLLRKYVEGLDSFSLEIMGYDKESIRHAVEEIKPPSAIGFIDFLSLLWVRVVVLLKPNIWFSKRISSWAGNRYLS